MINLSIVIPVGPRPSHRRWLQETLDSIYPQREDGDEILLVDDMASADLPGELANKPAPGSGLQVVSNPWCLGVASSFNVGVAAADHEYCLLMGSDDRLNRGALAAAREEIRINAHPTRTYFYFGVEYSDGRFQTAPCGAAVVSKALWRHLGGFPLESATGAQDAALLSIILGNGERAALLQAIDEGRPHYWYRSHNESDTATVGAAWQGVILTTRDLLTAQWKPPQWGRFT